MRRIAGRFIRALVACVPVALLSLALAPAASALPQVIPSVETDPMHGAGDSADDAAVWVDDDDSSRSLLIGTDKSVGGHGLALYDLTGHELAFYPDGRMNNVDVRYDIPLGSGRADIVGVSHRPDSGNKGGSFDFYRVNSDSRTLSLINRVTLSSLGKTDVMARGFAMYRSPVDGSFYVFGSDSGKTDQYRLDGSSGQIRLTWVRRLKLACPTEGLQADDGMARLYVAEENLAGVGCPDDPPGPGIWRFGAEPDDDPTGTLLANSAPPTSRASACTTRRRAAGTWSPPARATTPSTSTAATTTPTSAGSRSPPATGSTP